MMKPHLSARQRRHHAGFTLIEGLVTMVILGVLASIVAVFIRGPVLGYLESVRRAEMTDVADFTLRRISREVRLALPNSLRVTTAGGVTYIEFIVTSGGGRYRDEMDGVGTPLNFSDSASCAGGGASRCQFDVVGTMPVNPSISVGDFIVVYNLGQDSAGNSYAPADAYASCATATGCNIATVSEIAGNTVTLAAASGGGNIFASQSPPLPSPSSRFHVVPAVTQAITYACPTATGTLRRYLHYGITAAQGTPPIGGSSATMATNASCVVTYDANNVTNQRNGLLTISLTLTDAMSDGSGGNESVTLLREIHLDNSP